jgi:hypothetical protein
VTRSPRSLSATLTVGIDGEIHYERALRHSLAGITLAHRFVQRMPADTFPQRRARATAHVAALRVMRMGEWRPTFPYLAP